ncbi:MAG: NnrS family protein [Campylobacteraceae bacterium]|nr:NnrS family protein [Campylobacteraceae bacterium]
MQPFTIHPPKQVKPVVKQNYFLSQPHQPFFLFGIVWAIVSMIVFMLGFKGVFSLHVSPLYFHVYSLIFIVFSQFFHGFLLTTFPRFCASSMVSKRVYIAIFSAYEIGALLFTIGVFTSNILFLSGAGILLLAHSFSIYQLYVIYENGKSPIKKDPFWILVAHFIGLFSHFVFFIGFFLDIADIHIYWYDIAHASGFYLYIIFLTFTVATRMIPFFSHVQIQRTPKFVPIVFGILSVKVFCIIFTFYGLETGVDLILSLVLFKEFLRWKLPIFSSPAILWILHLALFWLPIGLFLGAIGKLCEYYFGVYLVYMDTHFLALGFLTTILIGFGTRIALGHSSQPPYANRFTKFIFILTQIALVARIIYSLVMGFDINALWTFDLSISLWLLLFGLWGYYYAPVLINGKKIN